MIGQFANPCGLHIIQSQSPESGANDRRRPALFIRPKMMASGNPHYVLRPENPGLPGHGIVAIEIVGE
jgi:hypothetical protein